jgi:biopolymer transport protein ExbD
VRVEALTERVRQMMINREDKSLFVRGDGSVTYQDLMSVIDKLKEAGIEKVGLVTRPAGGR